MSLLEFLSNGLLSYSWWQILLAVLLSTHVTIVCMTVYLHRCQAHRSLELHLAVSHTFRFWLWMTTGIETGPWMRFIESITLDAKLMRIPIARRRAESGR
jgi:stearoyl-CoA desaturase (delta-9 desaturase)